MKTKALSGVLIFINFILTQGIDSNNPSKNRNTDSNERILYGKPAAVSDFPFLVQLDIAGALGAGSIVSNNWILTAAHCVYDYACSEVIRIFPGVWALKKSVVPIGCLAHPLYSNSSNNFDIGLIETGEDLLQDGRAMAASLPAPGTFYPRGTIATVAGWGLTENKEISETLLRADFLVMEWDYCNDMWLEGSCFNKPRCDVEDLPLRTLCTIGVGNPASSTCFGDSGGPVLIDNKLAGVVSFGLSKKDSCEVGSPSLNTNVVDYLQWINFYIAP